MGITERGAATAEGSRLKTSCVSCGPNVQFMPTASAPAWSSVGRAWSALSPNAVRPSARKVISARTGIEAESLGDLLVAPLAERVDGRPLVIRALRPNDEADMLAAIERTGAQSLQRRFFVTKRGFSEKERAFFMNTDFVDHVALVAVIYPL